MSELLLLLASLPGYVFLHWCNLTRYRAQRLEGYRLLFESLGVGLAFGVLGRLSAYIIAGLFPAPETAWSKIAAAMLPPELRPYSGSATATLLLLAGVLLLANKRLYPTTLAKLLIAKRYRSELLELFLRAAEQPDPIIVTLNDRKVYVGYVQTSPVGEDDDSHFVLLPIMSGYRDPVTLQVRFAVDYISLWKNDTDLMRKFFTVIPIESVRSAHIFDTTISQSDFAMPAAGNGEGSDGDRDNDGNGAAAEGDAAQNREECV